MQFAAVGVLSRLAEFIMGAFDILFDFMLLRFRVHGVAFHFESFQATHARIYFFHCKHGASTPNSRGMLQVLVNSETVNMDSSFRVGDLPGLGQLAKQMQQPCRHQFRESSL
jgi:hypothetical protein